MTPEEQLAALIVPKRFRLCCGKCGHNGDWSPSDPPHVCFALPPHLKAQVKP